MWPYPKIIAHRGGGSLAPENTLAAFRCGFNYGFRAVEFDVMLTRDQVPVVIHDEILGRTVAADGLVCDMTAQQLQQFDAGSWYAPEFSATRVPTYREVLQFCTAHGIWMNVEIKPARGMEQITGAVVAKLTQEFYQSEVATLPLPPLLPLFSSFSIPALAAAQQVCPAIPRATLFDQLPPDWLDEVRRVDAIALHTNHLHLQPDQIAMIKRLGLGLSCYTVNSPVRARELLAAGVDALFTDELAQIPPDFA